MAILSFFQREQKGVYQVALLLGFVSFANGFLGLFRDRLLAGTFGATRNLDIYYASFRVPDFIFTLSLFFVASTAFIPIFLEHQGNSKKEAQDFLDSVFTLFIFSVLILLALSYVLMPFFIGFLTPGFDAAARNQAIFLSRMLLLSPFFLGISNLVSGVLQSSRKFFAYALSPVAYNTGIILGIIFFRPHFGLPGIIIGVILGTFFHIIIQIPTLLQIHTVPRFRFSTRAEPFRIFRYSFPRALALSLNQATLFFLTSLASTLGVGAISILYLSINLYTLPLTVIGLSYSVAAFPVMAELALQKEKNLFFDHLLAATRHIMFWTLPVVGFFIVLRAHIVRLVLGTGAFLWADTRLTAASLLLFSFAILFQSLVTLFVRGYYALGKTREPIVYNMIASIFIVASAYLTTMALHASPSFKNFLAGILRVSDLPNIEFLMIPLIYSVGSGLNALFLGLNLFRLGKRSELTLLRSSATSIFCVSACMAGTAFVALRVLNLFVRLDTFLGVAIQGGGAFFVAVGVGIFLYWMFDIQEFIEIRQALRSRFLQKEILQPDTEHL